MTAGGGGPVERIAIAAAERRAVVIDLIDSARARLNLSVFRCDDDGVMGAIGRAAARGVRVRALVTARARGSKGHLHHLRKRLRKMGVEVRRFDDPVVRYHAKYAIADASSAFVASLNFTEKCFRDTCDFVLVSRDAGLIGALLHLFDADWEGEPYRPGTVAAERLVVGPDHARARFTSLLLKARHTIRIIDPKISDSAMLRLLETRESEGVAVDIRDEDGLGPLLPHGKLLMIDDALAVMGSIALSTLALDFRRELAVTIDDRRVLDRLEEFWRSLPPARSPRPPRAFMQAEPNP